MRWEVILLGSPFSPVGCWGWVSQERAPREITGHRQQNHRKEHPKHGAKKERRREHHLHPAELPPRGWALRAGAAVVLRPPANSSATRDSSASNQHSINCSAALIINFLHSNPVPGESPAFLAAVQRETNLPPSARSPFPSLCSSAAGSSQITQPSTTLPSTMGTARPPDSVPQRTRANKAPKQPLFSKCLCALETLLNTSLASKEPSLRLGLFVFLEPHRRRE